MGLSVSDGVRVFLTRLAAEKQMPFALRAPNLETRAAMTEADEIVCIRRARFDTAAELFNDLEENRSSKLAHRAAQKEKRLCLLHDGLYCSLTHGPLSLHILCVNNVRKGG